MDVFLSPGIKTNLVDYSGVASSDSGTVVGIVGGATKGPVNTPTLITSEAQFVNTFGAPALTNYGQAAAILFLQNGSQLYYQRVTNGNDTIAKATVPSSSSTPTTSFIFESKYTGSGYNGDYIIISNINTTSTPTTFTAQVYNSAGTLLQTFANVSMYSSSSSYFPTVMSNSNLPYVISDPNNGAGSTPKAGTYTLSGGTSGDSNIPDANVIGTGGTGVSAFTYTDLYPIDLLITPGFNSEAVISNVLNLANQLGTFFYIIDPPQGITVQEVIEWSNGQGSYSSSMVSLNNYYSAVYWPWVEYYDAYNGVYRWMPPSAFMASQYAYNDNVGNVWDAPAGINRGILTLATGIEYSPNQGDRDALYGNGNVVNPIVKMGNYGIVVWGQKTTYRQQSDLNRVNVVRLLIEVRKAIIESSMFLVFEGNDQLLWNQWKSKITPYLQNIQNEGGLYAFSVVMDSSIVTNYDIQTHYLPGIIYLQPTLDAEYIGISFVLTPTGAQFTT